MTWITDGNGTRWVDAVQRKRRKPSRAIKFGAIKVGDQLVRVYSCKGWRGGIDDMKAPPVDLSRSTWYYIVTDIWFDPVKGFKDQTSGEMVAIRRLDINTGEPIGGKEPHSKRGLASNGFQYSDRDFIQFARDRKQAMTDGNVVGIGRGHALKRRPKNPGGL